MADTTKVKELGQKLFDLVKTRSGNFVDANADAKAFLLDRTKRIAELTLDLATATNDAAKESFKNSLSTVEESIDTELLMIANYAIPEAKSAFKAALKTVVGFAKEILPALLPMIL